MEGEGAGTICEKQCTALSQRVNCRSVYVDTCRTNLQWSLLLASQAFSVRSYMHREVEFLIHIHEANKIDLKEVMSSS